jgi:hypothetical protein
MPFLLQNYVVSQTEVASSRMVMSWTWTEHPNKFGHASKLGLRKSLRTQFSHNPWSEDCGSMYF